MPIAPSRRAVNLGLLASLVLGPPARAARPKPPEAEEIFLSVRASDGYLDAALHARFHRALAAMVGPDKVAFWLDERRKAQGDPSLAARFETELWASAIDSSAAGSAQERPELAAVRAEILTRPETEAVALRRLAAAATDILKTAAKQGWLEVDGQPYVLMMLECQTLLGSIAARQYRVAELLKPVYAPPVRRWAAPGCPVAFDLDAAIGTRFDSDFPETTTFVATLADRVVLGASVRPVVAGDAPGKAIAIDAEIAEARAARDGRILARDAAPFRGEPAGRVDYSHGSTPLAVATFTTVLPHRGMVLSVEVYADPGIEVARRWRDRLETAIVFV